MTNTELLCLALGWQGGTVHQISQFTGLTVSQIIDGDRMTERPSGDFWAGWFAVRTCRPAFNHDYIFPKYRGNIEFWMGVARGKELHLISAGLSK